MICGILGLLPLPHFTEMWRKTNTGGQEGYVLKTDLELIYLFDVEIAHDICGWRSLIYLPPFFVKKLKVV